LVIFSVDMDLKTLALAIKQIAAERELPPEKVLEALESCLAAAYKKQYREKTESIRAKFNPDTGEVKFFLVKTVITKDMVGTEEGKIKYNPRRHIFLEEARKINPNIKPNEEITFPLEQHQEFGRIAAQTAKQVILQKIREFEKQSIMKEFESKEGEIISGTVQRYDRGNVYVDLGRTSGIMFTNQSIPGEHYKVGQHLKFYLLAVQESGKTPGIILSRSHPEFLKKLFELEIQEIADGIVEIKAIAWEPGHRAKVAVYSKDKAVDPVGSCIGERGMRITAISNELGGEKIDIIEWDESPDKFIANALSPAKVKYVELLPKRQAKVYVAEDQLSLALGKGGQNVRLAAKLTNWKIDVVTAQQVEVKKSTVQDMEASK